MTSIQPKTVICPGCGLTLPSQGLPPDSDFNASGECRALCHELGFFTLELAAHDPSFIHQLLVDTYAAQHAGPDSKTIGIAFALIGLHLFFDRNYTGREVQLAHIALAKKTKKWPRFTLPKERGEMTVRDVVEVLDPKEREAALVRWGKSVWSAWTEEHAAVRALTDTFLFS